MKKLLLLQLVLFILPQLLLAQGRSKTPWMSSMDPENNLSSIRSLAVKAGVSVSDGLSFETHSFFIDRQRAIYHQQYDTREATYGVEGMNVWAYDGITQSELPLEYSDFVLGHNFHAQLLYFDTIYDSISNPSTGKFSGKKCKRLSTTNSSGFEVNMYYRENGLPLGMTFGVDGGTVEIEYKSWQVVEGFKLPFQIKVFDGQRNFDFKISSVAFNEDSLDDFRAPITQLTEKQRLLRSHRVIMDGHLLLDNSEMEKNVGDSIIIGSSGDVYQITANQANSSMARRFGNRLHYVYDDLIAPIVRLSEDNTLGWVTVQVYAKGVRLDPEGEVTDPLEFTCAWIELYQKIDDKWKMVGNFSNFRPD